MGKVEFQFPIKGKDTNNPVDKQPLLTSPYLENVRPWDVMEKRLRGGQRPAVRKWGAGSRISGDHRIDKLVAAARGTMPGDCPNEEDCESQGYHWWDDDTCHENPPIPGDPERDLPANLWKCLEDSDRASVVWSYDFGGGTVTAITTDSSGNVYAVIWRTAGEKLLAKLDSDGNLIWDYATGGSQLLGVAVDSSGNVYIAGSRSGTGDKSVWKLDSDGNLVASYDTGDGTTDIALDSSGNVFVTGDRVASKSVWKLDGDLNYVTSYDTGTITLGVAIDGSDNIYITGYRNVSSINVWKLNNDLGGVWTYDTGSTYGNQDVKLDSSGNVNIRSASSATDAKEIWQLDSSGGKNWYADCDSDTGRLAVDIATDNIYVTGNGTSIGLWVYDSSGNLLWSDGTGANLVGASHDGTNLYLGGVRIT